MSEKKLLGDFECQSFIIFILKFSLQHPVVFLWWFRVCIRVSVRNISFQKKYIGTQSPWIFVLSNYFKDEYCFFNHHHSSPSSLLANIPLYIPMVGNQLLGSQMEIVADRMQLDNTVEKPWALELKATRPVVCDAHHPPFHLSTIPYLKFTSWVPQFQTNQGLSFGFFATAGLASLLSL